MIKQKVGKFSIFSEGEFSKDALDQLVELFHTKSARQEVGLEGRRSVTRGKLAGVGPIVVKHFARGGLLGKFISRYFLNTGSIRSQIEFEMLHAVQRLGVPVIEPIAYAFSGGLIYKCWLVTREFEGTQTLAELSRVDEQRAQEISGRVAEHVARLVRNQILHIDLHPGNVLVSSDELRLIDFDKATYYTGSAERLRDRYLVRWRRAVIKHQLPDVLVEGFSLPLRQLRGQES